MTFFDLWRQRLRLLRQILERLDVVDKRLTSISGFLDDQGSSTRERFGQIDATLRLAAKTQRDHTALLTGIIERTRNMANQDDINRLTDTVNGAADRIGAGIDGVRQDIADLKAANPGVDTTALEASVARLAGEADALTALDAENPAAPPAGSAAEVPPQEPTA